MRERETRKSKLTAILVSILSMKVKTATKRNGCFSKFSFGYHVHMQLCRNAELARVFSVRLTVNF